MLLSRWMNVAILICIPCSLFAQATVQRTTVLVCVQDSQNTPVSGIKIGVEEGGDARETDESGYALITLAGSLKEVTFHIVKSPPGENYVIVSPYNRREQVPVSDDKSGAHVSITVAPKSVYKVLFAHPRMSESTTRIPNKASKP
jgi:hypothetical protein